MFQYGLAGSIEECGDKVTRSSKLFCCWRAIILMPKGVGTEGAQLWFSDSGSQKTWWSCL